MLQLDYEMPKGCMNCRLRHWIETDDGEFDICGLTGKDIPYYINSMNPEQKRSDCPLPNHSVAVVPVELFLEVLEKYKESEECAISSLEVQIPAEYESLNKEIAEYKKRAGIAE